MISDLDSFSEHLNGLDPSADDFVLQADALIEELDPKPGAIVAPRIFAYFEAHPTSDMGAPGTLIHYLELFYPEYVGELMDSLKRSPSFNAVLMANRILNSPNCPAGERGELLEALQTVASTSPHEEIRSLAERYCQRHSPGG